MDFIDDIAHGRPVVCASMTGPRPAHLARRWRAFFKHKKAVAGVDEWWRELSQACDAWHADHERRIAVCVGTKRQLKQVCAFFEEKKVPWKPYCGDSNDEFTTGNYDVTTTSATEWKFVAMPDQPPPGGWPVEQKLVLAGEHDKMRKSESLAALEARMGERSAQLAAQGEPPMMMEEAIAAKQYTGPLCALTPACLKA